MRLRAAFGDYISVYRMSQAQEDGATVPIYYESRQVPLDIDAAELAAAQGVLDAEGEDVQTELSGEFARMDRIIGAPERLDAVCDDIAAHFTDRCATLPGKDAVARYVLDDERSDVLLDEHAQYAKWFSLVSPNEPTVAQRYDHDVFATIAKALRLARAEEQEGDGSGPTREARRAVEQFFSAGLAGSEILDVFAMAGDARPEISVLSDDFLDDVASRLTRPELQVALMKKLLNGEIRTRLAGNRVQHKRFSDEVTAVLARYEAKQITSAEVVKELVKLARDLRSQARRHEQLGLSREETAFYDALAAKGEDFVDDPRLKEIAVDLVAQVRQDLAVDWTQRGNLEARIRAPSACCAATATRRPKAAAVWTRRPTASSRRHVRCTSAGPRSRASCAERSVSWVSATLTGLSRSRGCGELATAGGQATVQRVGSRDARRRAAGGDSSRRGGRRGGSRA
jgi:type I site-specific restriction-modification system R (restriction) subunit